LYACPQRERGGKESTFPGRGENVKQGAGKKGVKTIAAKQKRRIWTYEEKGDEQTWKVARREKVEV